MDVELDHFCAYAKFTANQWVNVIHYSWPFMNFIFVDSTNNKFEIFKGIKFQISKKERQINCMWTLILNSHIEVMCRLYSLLQFPAISQIINLSRALVWELFTSSDLFTTFLLCILCFVFYLFYLFTPNGRKHLNKYQHFY